MRPSHRPGITRRSSWPSPGDHDPGTPTAPLLIALDTKVHGQWRGSSGSDSLTSAWAVAVHLQLAAVRLDQRCERITVTRPRPLQQFGRDGSPPSSSRSILTPPAAGTGRCGYAQFPVSAVSVCVQAQIIRAERRKPPCRHPRTPSRTGLFGDRRQIEVSDARWSRRPCAGAPSGSTPGLGGPWPSLTDGSRR